MSQGTMFVLGSGTNGIDLTNFLPDTQEHCESLLSIFFSNVDPMTRIIHKPTLLRRFDQQLRDTHPIAFAIFFSAVNSMTPSAVKETFGARKDILLERFEQGLEVSLARENFLTAASLEVLQGFVLWLVSAPDFKLMWLVLTM
jgi:hypothetical protein